MEREWSGNRMGMRGNEAETVRMERERNGNTVGMEKKWRGNGVETEREWRGNVAGKDPTPLSVPGERLGPSASSCQVLNSATEELLAAATGTGWAALVWVDGWSPTHPLSRSYVDTFGAMLEA